MTEKVRNGVHCEQMMQDDHSSNHPTKIEGGHRVFTPTVHRNRYGKANAQDDKQRHIESVLAPDDPVVAEVAEVELISGRLHRGRLLQAPPANVRVEEASTGVLRIGISVRVLVVRSVVSGVAEGAAVHGHGLKGGEEEF